MNKPKAGELFESDAYWDSMDHNVSGHPYPVWVFYFISIHKPTNRSVYSLLSPLSLVSSDGSRPEFEDEEFPTMELAVARAKELAKENGVFIVDCTEGA